MPYYSSQSAGAIGQAALAAISGIEAAKAKRAQEEQLALQQQQSAEDRAYTLEKREQEQAVFSNKMEEAQMNNKAAEMAHGFSQFMQYAEVDNKKKATEILQSFSPGSRYAGKEEGEDGSTVYVLKGEDNSEIAVPVESIKGFTIADPKDRLNYEIKTIKTKRQAEKDQRDYEIKLERLKLDDRKASAKERFDALRLQNQKIAISMRGKNKAADAFMTKLQVGAKIRMDAGMEKAKAFEETWQDITKTHNVDLPTQRAMADTIGKMSSNLDKLKDITGELPPEARSQLMEYNDELAAIKRSLESGASTAPARNARSKKPDGSGATVDAVLKALRRTK